MEIQILSEDINANDLRLGPIKSNPTNISWIVSSIKVIPSKE